MRLLRADEKVCALGRSQSKLAELKKSDAETLTGDAADAALLAQAFRGAGAIHTLIPIDPHSSDCLATQNRQGEAIANAIRQSGVRFVEPR